MKSKDLIKFLQKFDENAKINIFLLDKGERIPLYHANLELVDINLIDINIHEDI